MSLMLDAAGSVNLNETNFPVFQVSVVKGESLVVLLWEEVW